MVLRAGGAVKEAVGCALAAVERAKNPWSRPNGMEKTKRESAPGLGRKGRIQVRFDLKGRVLPFF